MENLSTENLQKQDILIDCVDLELAVSLIYREFMQMFPAERKFWEQLALEEEDHARLYMAGDLINVAGELSGIQFPPAALITKTLEFTEQVKAQIHNRAFTLKEALELSLKLEKTVSESIIFEYGKTDSPLISNLRKIIRETESHADRIEQLMIEKGFSYIG